jgi:regulator of sigma E protease
MSWVITILGIVALIVLHELGHFAVAKAVGMRVERFSLFFPPKLVGVRRGETEYSIGAIPFGGYVRITGMTPEELRTMDARIAVRGFSMQEPWKRVAVILAGPLTNVLIAFVLFAAVLLSGDLNGVFTIEELSRGCSTCSPSVHTVVDNTSVEAINRGSPAAASLRLGDRILAADGTRATVASVRRRVDSHRCARALVGGCTAATPVRLTILRGGRTVTESVYPRYDAVAKRMLLGFGFGAASKSFGVASAASTALDEMLRVSANTVTGFGHALTSQKARGEVSSIVGITKAAHETVVHGTGYALVFLAFISLILAVINLFPFLPLDGGHVLWAIAEKVRGKRISVASMYRYSSVGIVLMLFLVLNGIGNDIGRLGG